MYIERKFIFQIWMFRLKLDPCPNLREKLDSSNFKIRIPPKAPDPDQDLDFNLTYEREWGDEFALLFSGSSIPKKSLPYRPSTSLVI